MASIANTFHGVPDETRVCQAVVSALKPGGRFVVVNRHRRPRQETTVFGQPRGPKTEMRMEPSMIETYQNREPAENRSGAQSPMVMPMGSTAKELTELTMPPQGDWWQYMPWFGMFMGPVMMVLFIVIAFLVIVPLMRAMGMGPPTWHGHYPPYPPHKTALDILNERFARGEINKEEYDEKRRIISQG